MASEGSQRHTEPRSARVRLDESRSGEIGAAVAALLANVGELSPADRVTAALIRRTANVCDAAYEADDPRMMLAAHTRLERLIGRLGGEHGGSSDRNGDVGDELERAIRGAPTV